MKMVNGKPLNWRTRDWKTLDPLCELCEGKPVPAMFYIEETDTCACEDCLIDYWYDQKFGADRDKDMDHERYQAMSPETRKEIADYVDKKYIPRYFRDCFYISDYEAEHQNENY